MLEPRLPAAFQWLFVVCAVLGFGALTLEGAGAPNALFPCSGSALLVAAVRWRLTRRRPMGRRGLDATSPADDRQRPLAEGRLRLLLMRRLPARMWVWNSV